MICGGGIFLIFSVDKINRRIIKREKLNP